MNHPSAISRVGGPLAVLVSGGLDSAILLGESLRVRAEVYPLYVHGGLYWEPVELKHLERFLEAMRGPTMRSLQLLELPVADLYGEHWSVNGRNVPDALSTDDAVYLPGRNVLLLSKALLWCHLHGIDELVLAPLASNPFPDATSEFFAAFQNAVNRAVGGKVVVRAPYTGLTKREVMHRGGGLPLELTFSCIQPVEGSHCGRCNKCGERKHAFADAGMNDATEYAFS